MKLTISIAYLRNPTNPDYDSSSSSSTGGAVRASSTPGVQDPSLAPAPMLSQANISGQAPFEGVGMGLGTTVQAGLVEPNYEVFDPLNWLLDGVDEFPHSYSTLGMEPQGIA